MKKTLGGFDETALVAIKVAENICFFVCGRYAKLISIIGFTVEGDCAYRSFTISGEIHRPGMYFETAFTIEWKNEKWCITDTGPTTTFHLINSGEDGKIELSVSRQGRLAPDTEIDRRRLKKMYRPSK